MNIFADVGNTAIKWCEMGELLDLSLRAEERRFHEFTEIFQRVERSEHQVSIPVSHSSPCCWWISSVHQPAAEWLAAWIKSTFPEDRIEWVTRHQMPIEVDLDQPETVGLDRLLGAVAVNARRDLSSNAVVCDFGTATTVNVVNSSGVFVGGAILPGIQTQLRALAQATDGLPRIGWKTDSPPASLVGKRTEDAILSGVVNGHSFGVVEMCRRLVAECQGPTELWLTGGGIPNVELDWPVTPRFIPHLVLEGIGLYAISRMKS